jgi:hypothetical protein
MFLCRERFALRLGWPALDSLRTIPPVVFSCLET